MTEQDFAHIVVSDWLALHPEMPVVIAGDTRMHDVALTLLANNSRDAYIVNDDNKVLGHLGFGKMANHLLSEHRPIHTHRQLFARVTDPTAAELMDPHFAYARTDESLCEVIHRQLERDVDTLVVLSDDNMLLGSVNLRDLVAESLK